MASKRKFEEHMPAAKAALYLELIAAGLRKGSAYLDPRDLTTAYRLPPEMDFEMQLKLRPKKSRGRLAIELTWSTNADGPKADDGDS